jgi:hypothetical protein
MKNDLAELKVKGRTHDLAIEPSPLLLDLLRQEWGPLARRAAAMSRAETTTSANKRVPSNDY